MTTAVDARANRLAQAGLPANRLIAEQVALIQACWRIRHRRGAEYVSTHLLMHFLLHSVSGVKVAQSARPVRRQSPRGVPQQGIPSRQVNQQALDRLNASSHGKLLPRDAGSRVGFRFQQPNASADRIDFIGHTWACGSHGALSTISPG